RMSIVLSQNQVVRRDRVIEAAMRLAGEGGYDAVQMRDVAARAGVALGTVYRYFSSKDHLLAAALLEWARSLEEAPTRVGNDEDPVERLVAVIRRITRASGRAPELFAALVTAITAPDPAVSECQAQVQHIVSGVLSAPLTDVDPEIRAGAVRVLAHVWFASLLGWVNGWTAMGQVADELEFAARLLLREN
ncbi:MAG: TetR/AcrR family transcriptional regulator, cholesterol catabolism regulator, partial [Actinomycetota bacterium]